MRRFRRPLVFALLAGAGLFVLTLAVRSPSLDREWDPDVRVLAGVEFREDGGVLLTNVRDWSYTRDTVVARSYVDAVFDPDDIVDLWLYEQPLGAGGLIAHTFVVFEFGEEYGPDRYLGLSVETRREAHEEYSLVGGALRAFEVTHIWARERDLVTRRVEYLDYPLRRHRLDIPPEVRSRVFLQFSRETADLATRPRWYNTVSNNCTSSLIRYVNESVPGAIPLHHSYVLTGRVDEYLRELGYLADEPVLEVTRAYLADRPLR